MKPFMTLLNNLTNENAKELINEVIFNKKIIGKSIFLVMKSKQI